MLPIDNDPTTSGDDQAIQDEPFRLSGDSTSPSKDDEKRKAYARAYYQANKERIKARVKAYNEADPERKKERDQAYYQANKEEMDRKNRENYRANKDYYREYEKRRSKDKVAYNRQRDYGITPEEFARMEVAQDYRCAICRTPFLPGKRKGGHVDHCHTTGKIRGLLCDHCNKGIGMAGDDADTLALIIRYLAVKVHAVAWPRSSKKFRIRYVKSLVGDGRASHRVAEKAKLYGISVELLMGMFELQAAKCAVCKAGINPKSCNIDHCHKCNQVRGLLCLKCNVCVAMFQDDPSIIRQAIAYLKEHANDVSDS